MGSVGGVDSVGTVGPKKFGVGGVGRNFGLDGVGAIGQKTGMGINVLLFNHTLQKTMSLP